MLSLARYHAVNQLLLLKRLFLQIYSCSRVYPPFSAITRASAGSAVPICTESLHLCNLPIYYDKIALRTQVTQRQHTCAGYFVRFSYLSGTDRPNSQHNCKVTELQFIL